MAYQPPLPTLGYPTREAAIVALHKAGASPWNIAQVVSTSINSVHRTLTRYRKRKGIPTPTRQPRVYVPAVNQCDPLWDMEEDERRDEIRRRAAVAARAARLAA
jgi:hypothetical protein